MLFFFFKIFKIFLQSDNNQLTKQILNVFGTEFLSFYNSLSELVENKNNKNEYNSISNKILYLQKYFTEICEGFNFKIVLL